MYSFSFNHVAISVKDVNISAQFYMNVLQLKEIENTASNSKTRWMSLDQGKQLHLIPRPDEDIKISKAVHFALATPNINAFIENLVKMNIPYSDWRDTPSRNYIRNDGVQQFYFQDPDGYWIEVNEAESN